MCLELSRHSSRDIKCFVWNFLGQTQIFVFGLESSRHEIKKMFVNKQAWLKYD